MYDFRFDEAGISPRREFEMANELAERPEKAAFQRSK